MLLATQQSCAFPIKNLTALIHLVVLLMLWVIAESVSFDQSFFYFNNNLMHSFLFLIHTNLSNDV